MALLNPIGQLKQGMNLADVVALGVSAAVGMSIFSITAPATAVAGPAMLLSLAAAAVPMIIFVVVYAFVGSALPRSGSSYDWPARFVHPYAGFIVAWLRILGNAGSLQLMATVFTSYLTQAVAVPARPTMLLLLFVFYVINLLGVGVAGKAASGLVLLKLVVLGAFIYAGLAHVRPESFTPFLPHGPWSIFAALPLLIGLYTGIESAAEVGEETRNSKTTIGIALAVATLIGMTLYFGTAIVTLGVLGPAAVAVSRAPLLEAGRNFLGPWVAPLLLITALASIAGAVNGTILIFTRFLFAMGRDRALPAVLARIHPRWGTPHVAATAAFLLGVLALALPSNLVFLFLAANIPTMLKYFFNCLSAVRLVDHHAGLHRQAAFRLSRQAVKAWAYAGMGCALVIIVAGLGADWKPYAILAVWGGVGTLYWFGYGRHVSLCMRERKSGPATLAAIR
jgi:APA family basic amino acid/polyamine antiporter